MIEAPEQAGRSPATTSPARPAIRLPGFLRRGFSGVRVRFSCLIALSLAVGACLGLALAGRHLWLVAAVLAIVPGVWVMANWLIYQRLHVLVDASKQMALGNLQVRAASAGGAEELNQLAHSVDAMAKALRIEQAEARLAQEACQESDDRYRAVIEGAPDPIITVNKAGNIQSINPALERVSGYQADELLGRHIAQIGVFDAPSMAKALQEFAMVMVGRPRAPFEVDLLRKDDARYIFEANPHPILRGQEIVGMQIILRDVTQRKHVELALREANRRLEQALTELQATQKQVVEGERLQALGQMASGIAHDFNNILSSILGFSEMLIDHPDRLMDRQKATQYLLMIHTAAQDAAGVVRRLREFYRNKGTTEVFQRVNLNEIIEQAAALTQPRWKDQALSRGVTIRVGTDLKPVPPVAGNAVELRELLTNLIFNAVDAMPNGGAILISTAVEGQHALLEIDDTGTGMSEEVRRRCLEPFFTTKGAQGSGLGLAMVYGIVQRHGGLIQIESQLGMGTTFTIRLPLSAEQGASGDESEESLPMTRPLHVLVVDDDLKVREVTKEFLLSDGHTVETAENGRDGLIKFYAGWFDLVITDKSMPEMNGDRLAESIKQVSPNKPVILLTGFGDIMRAEGERPKGVDEVLNKPVANKTLRQAIAKLIQRPGAKTD